MIESKNPNVKAFKKAREKLDESVREVASRMGITPDYVYKLIKYPNMNPDKFKKLCDYIESADVEVPNKFKGNYE